MKCAHFILFIFSITLFSNTTLSSKISTSKWEYKSISYLKLSLKIVVYKGIDSKSIKTLLELADKSSKSKHPMNLETPYNSIFGPDDILCITDKLFLWFSVTSKKNGRIVRTGGGLLAGAWEIQVDNKTKKPNFKKIEKESLYIPNTLLPGSEPGYTLFGADAFGGYPASKVVWGLEHAQDVKVSTQTGKDILSIDRGPFSADEGVFIQFTGIVGNSQMDSGLESPTDTDPRPGIKGRTEYTLTYRIPSHRSDFIQEISYKAVENHFGPISNAYLALYIAGHKEKNMVYASNPELMPKTEGTILSNVQVNKYFKNSCVKKVYFYDVAYKLHKGKKHIVQTPEGRGRLACVGSPDNKISFICAYPNNDYIPKTTYEEYALEISDNQTLSKYGKFTSLSYKLLSSPNKTLTIKQGETLLLIIRYKFIDAQVALPDGYNIGNLQKKQKKKGKFRKIKK